MESIVAAFGAGSGIDLKALVAQLSAAARTPKVAALDQRAQRNEARLSALAQASSAISEFSSSLANLASGGTLTAQPRSSNLSMVSATAIDKGRFTPAMSATVEITALARSQIIVSQAFQQGSEHRLGAGRLAIETGAGTTEIEILPGQDRLSDVASAINASGVAVQARVVTNADGAKLSLTSRTGTTAAFSVSLIEGDANGLGLLAYAGAGTGAMTLVQDARDANLTVDGIAISRPSNHITDLFDNIALDIVAVGPGQPVIIEASPEPEALGNAIKDFVSAYNEVQAQLASLEASAGSSARGEPAIRDLRKTLAKLSTQQLSSRGGSVRSLAEVGVRTARDGKLSVDDTILAAVTQRDPSAVSRFFYPESYVDSDAIVLKGDTRSMAPGVYRLSQIVAAPPGGAASGLIDGVEMTAVGAKLIAPRNSAVAGLILSVTRDTGTATLTIDPGLTGSLRHIASALRKEGSAISSAQVSLRREADLIASQKDTVERRATRYEEQLLNLYSAMDGRVAVLKASQSYLTQQIAIWNSSGDR